MTKDKDLKRLVRARMEKTGESYTAARSQLLEKNDPLPADYSELAGMSDDAVRAKTGKTWKEWVRLLDEIEARALPHREIAEHVLTNHEISGWWAQTVTVGYERIRGLREMGQRRGGGYDVNKSKTVPVSVTELYRAFTDQVQRERWLPGVVLTVSTGTTDKSLRMKWEDGRPVDAYFTAKGDAKSSVQLQHRALATKEDADRVREYWGQRLAALARVLGGAASF